MNISSLHPPNYESLSEAVISDVVQRPSVKSRPFSYTHTAHVSIDYTSSRSEYLQTSSQGASPSHEERKLISSTISMSAEGAILLKRQQRRQTQQRYRKKVREKEGTIDCEVQMLREQVKRLNGQHKQNIAQSVPLEAKRWGVVAEYFRLFGRGLATNTLPTVNNSASNMKVQRGFLQATMAPDVSVNTGYGIDRLLWGWETLSRYYPDCDVKLVTLEIGAGNSLLATTKATRTITEDTLKSVFQHLIGDARGSLLGAKLLGKQLVVKGSGFFIWDDAKDRVISTLYSVDMLTPMLELLGSLEDVSHVLDNSRYA